MDVNGGELTQSNGNPIFPGTAFTGPLLAGNILHGDGTSALAGAGEMTGGLANVGYITAAQVDVITQATNGSVAGVYTSGDIVIPAQSQILRITGMVTTAWTGASTTLGIGTNLSATAFTAAGAGNANARGIITFSPGTNATAIANWDNTGSTDVQIVITSTNTGSGVMTLTVEYIQGINNAS